VSPVYRVMAAGSAAVMFAIGFVVLMLGSFDRAAAAAALLGLFLLSLAFVAHIADSPRR
jgi:hypothetical protein